MKLHRGIAIILAFSVAMLGFSAKTTSAQATTVPTVYIGVDLPFSGAYASKMTDAYNSMNAYLKKVGGKAGKYKVVLRKYDNGNSSYGWNDAKCKKNAKAHVKAETEVAVIAPYLSGCSKLQIPILNSKNMMMISFSNTYPGLTMALERGEPGIYYPNKKRNYARVSTPDNVQGFAAAQYAFKMAGKRHCAVIDDKQTWGKNLGDAYESTFKKLGGLIDRYAWDFTAESYTLLFDRIRDSGADCLYISGIYDSNGEQLFNDAISVLGSQSEFFKIASDGFSGYPNLLENPEAEGLYITSSGEPLEAMAGRIRMKRTYVSDLSVHAIAALQVVLAAIAKSKGTKSSVRDQVFTGKGISISAKTSILSEAFSINPKTGDNSRRVITLYQVTSGVEKFRQIMRIP